MAKKILTLLIISLFALCVFLLYDMNFEIFNYVIQKRIAKIVCMTIVAIAIGLSTLSFQAVTNNRILTPGILGLDSLYQLFQLITVVAAGGISVFVTNVYLNFFTSAALMTAFSLVLFKWVFNRAKSIFLIVLVGVVMGTFFTSINGMLQIMISPDVYNLILGKLFASFSVVQSELIGISTIIIVIISTVIYKKRYILDVMALGKDHSVNLGLSYDKEVMQILVMVFLLVSISTALVGPITFLGFFSVNITKNYLNHHQHAYLMLGTCLVSVAVLFLGQFMVEHVFNFGLPISVLISMVGGSYFIYMLLKENKA